MARFLQTPEFVIEFKKLAKKYPSLVYDVEDLRAVLEAAPTGIGKNFTIIRATEDVKIIKVRVHCELLRDRRIRLIYAFHQNKIEFVYIELYFKGDKENEDKQRVENYLNNIL